MSRRNPTVLQPATLRQVQSHLDWTDPDAIGGRSLHIPRGDDYDWTLERWAVSDLPAISPMSKRKAGEYTTIMRSGGLDIPALVMTEGKPEYDSITGEILRRGRMEMFDGAHRLYAARDAGVKELDVFVGRRRET